MRVRKCVPLALPLAIAGGVLIVHSTWLSGSAYLPPVRCQHAAGNDYVLLVQNSMRDRATVLVDGVRTSGECVNDMAVMGTSMMNIGAFVARTESCPSASLLVFGSHQAMQWLDASGCWSPEGDRAYISMKPSLLTVPIHVWTVGAVPEGEDALHAAQVEVQRANQLFGSAGAGFELTNLTAVTAARANVAHCADLTQYDRDAAALNIYFAYNAYSGEAGDARGFACPGDAQMIVRNATADPETLAHELGHAMSLAHFTDDSANVMTAGGVGRDNLTTGQAFRANVQPPSLLNTLHIRNGPTQKGCHEINGGVCPSARCTGCPNVPALLPWQTQTRLSSSEANEASVQIDAAVAQWLTCEECQEQELETIRNTPAIADRFIELVSGLLREETREFLETKLRESYRSLRVYEADPRNVKVSDNEESYVNRYVTNARALQQIRAVRALVALRPRMSDAQRARARGAIQTANRATTRADVRRALESAAAAI